MKSHCAYQSQFMLRCLGVLIACLVGLIGQPSYGEAAGPTPVSGEIKSSQTWTRDGSPYVVIRDIVVKPGVTLTLEPGTVVQFARIEQAKTWTKRAVLRVMGRLKAVGTMAAPVEFTLLEGEAMGDWGGIWVDGYTGGSVELDYVRISWAQRGIYAAGADIHLRNSVFTGNLTAVYLEGGTGHLIENNNLSRNETGIYADRAAGSIERNVLASNSWGIYNFMEKGLHIRHNDIKSNTYGIVHDSGSQSEITRNDFSIRRSNDYAVLVRGGHPAMVTENNFLYDEQLALDPGSVFWYIFNESSSDIEAPNNWWDTTNKQIIEAFTYDKRDFSLRGQINYEPIATERVKGTMDDLRPPQVEILDLLPCSPNGDGVADTCVIPYSLSETAVEVIVSIIDAGGIVGTAGDTIWQRTYRADGNGGAGDGAFITDGTHTVTWNGVTSAGATAPEGMYEVLITALDVSGVGEGETAATFRVDMTPPEIVVDEPAPGTVLHQAFVNASGTVRDLSDLSVRIGSNTASLAAGTDGWWRFAGQTVLTAADGALAVTATDKAGNRNVVELAVVFDPWLTMEIERITNQKSISVQGEVLNPALKRVELRVTWPQGGEETVFATINPAVPFARYASNAPVPLERGANLVVAYGYGADDQGVEYLAASTAAWIEYNPFYDRTVSHEFTPGISMITVPSTPNAAAPGTALGLAGDWDLARWQETETGYGYVRQSVAPVRLDPLQPGYGYWLRLGAGFPTGHTAQVRGMLADNTKPFPIRLWPGWNLIGNPFLESVEWSTVEVQVEGSASVGWTAAVEQGWLQPVMWGYSGGGYRTATQLVPWQGYWVKSSRALTLLVPPLSTVGAGGVGAGGVGASVASRVGPSSVTRQAATKAAVSNAAAGYVQSAAVPGPGEWRLAIVARSGLAVDMDNYMGAARQASDGFDRLYDWEEPPLALQGVTFSFSGARAGDASSGASEVNMVGSPLAADIRSLTLGSRVWQASVHSSGVEPVQLSWPTASLLPPEVQITLVDEQTGIRTDLRKTREYTFTPKQAGEIRAFRLEAQEAGASEIAGLLIYPNPWRGEGIVHLKVDLTGHAMVTAGIYDALGRLVRRLDAVAGGPGVVELTWDGRTSRDERAPSGLYQARVVATTIDELGVGMDVKRSSAAERLVVWR